MTVTPVVTRRYLFNPPDGAAEETTRLWRAFKGAQMSSPRAMQVLFLKANKPDISQVAPLPLMKHDGRRQDSRKKRLLFAIKRDLRAADSAAKDSSYDSLKLVEQLEAVRCTPPTGNFNEMSAAAAQLSQSISLIERFLVDQMPQGSMGDNVLSAWNCLLMHSFRVPPLTRHARPRVVEQLRCRAETVFTSNGSRLNVFRAESSSAEQFRVSRIEQLLVQAGGDSASAHVTQQYTPQLKAPSPRARFVQHVSHKPSTSAPAPTPFAASGSKNIGAVVEKEKPESAGSSNAHFERLLHILACKDQRVQTREVNKELDTIRENLKQMKGRVSLMTERLQVSEIPETVEAPLEPHERHVRKHGRLTCCGNARCHY